MLSGLNAEDMALNRDGHSTDPMADAAVQSAQKVAKSRGHIETADFDAVKAAGYTDAQVIDIVAELASFITNLCNSTFKTDIDKVFPVLEAEKERLDAPWGGCSASSLWLQYALTADNPPPWKIV
jgi:hypothetical protein